MFTQHSMCLLVTPKNMFPLLQSSVLYITFSKVCLECSSLAMKTHSTRLFMDCSWTNLKVTWSLKVCRDRKFCLSIRWPRSVRSHVQLLCCRAAVVPGRFPFVITPLTVDGGICRNLKMLSLDFWHPITALLHVSQSDPLFYKSFLRKSASLWPWQRY